MLVADILGLPFLDKDDILESEFEKFQSVDLELRQELSRQSDLIFRNRASALKSGVLVSFWRPVGQAVSYGTATDWIDALDAPVVELHCRCDPSVARARFLKRNRHPGHNDALRHESLVEQLNHLAAFGPLGLWPCVSVETTDLRDIASLAEEASNRIEDLMQQRV
jgi:glucokinase